MLSIDLLAGRLRLRAPREEAFYIIAGKVLYPQADRDTNAEGMIPKM